MSHHISETGPCDKCQGSGQLLDRRIGDVECDECEGHGWFNDGVAGPAQDAPHHWVCAINRGGKCTCSVLDGAACEESAGSARSNKPAASSAPESSVSVPKEQQAVEILRELMQCAHSDPYAKKPWAPGQLGRFLTVNMPGALWDRARALTAGEQQ